MGRLKGIDVTLYTQTQSGTDDFGMPIYTETAVTVSNVLVQPATATDVVDNEKLYGKKCVYNIAIPKGDTNDWEDKKVSFLSQTFHTFGPVVQGIEALVPTQWHKKVMCERYE